MTALPEGFRTYTQEDIQRNFPFFGPQSLFVTDIQIETNPDGSVGKRAIGHWKITEDVCADHFARFTAQLRRGEEEVNMQLMPGHYGPELLGQTLGGLVAARYPDQFVQVLPSYSAIHGTAYNEPAFPGDVVNLCVRLEEELFDTKGRLRMIQGSGVVVFNEKIVSVASQMVVNINPLEVGVKGLARIRTKHQTDPWIPASLGKFDQYFADAGKLLNPSTSA